MSISIICAQMHPINVHTDINSKTRYLSFVSEPSHHSINIFCKSIFCVCKQGIANLHICANLPGYLLLADVISIKSLAYLIGLFNDFYLHCRCQNGNLVQFQLRPVYSRLDEYHCHIEQLPDQLLLQIDYTVSLTFHQRRNLLFSRNMSVYSDKGWRQSGRVYKR